MLLTLGDESGGYAGYSGQAHRHHKGPSSAQSIERDDRHQISRQFQGSGHTVGDENAVR
jgi:hypothetical protein